MGRKKKVVEVPDPKYGEGSISIRKDTGKYCYKKVIICDNGRKIRKSVTADTKEECFKKMAKLEKETKKANVPHNKQTLSDALTEYMEYLRNSTSNKQQSFDRIETTINYISNSDLGRYRYYLIDDKQITTFLRKANEIDHHSHSTIKKYYNLLNAFYRYKSTKEGIDNPMALVKMIAVSEIKPAKKPTFFPPEDIEKMIQEAGATWSANRLRHKHGYAIVANIFLGLRAGELLSLKWEDVDFENKTVSVTKTQVTPRDKKNNGKNSPVIQDNTKTGRTRNVPMNKRAEELLQKHYENSDHTQPSDFVISSTTGKMISIKNLSDVIKSMEQSAGTSVKECNSHILRHTCASLYFRAGVPIQTIATILGNSPRVLEETYIHLLQEQLEKASAEIIYDIDIQ